MDSWQKFSLGLWSLVAPACSADNLLSEQASMLDAHSRLARVWSWDDVPTCWQYDNLARWLGLRGRPCRLAEEGAWQTRLLAEYQRCVQQLLPGCGSCCSVLWAAMRQCIYINARPNVAI
jgi:hypothetical protein